MGRTIPSISARLDGKIAQWTRFSKLLPKKEREAFGRLVSIIRDRRTAIDAADEADIGIAILLAMMTAMKGELDERPGGEDRQGLERGPSP